MPSTTLGWASLEGEELLWDANPGMGISQGVVLLWDQLSWDDFRLCLLLLGCKPGFAPSVVPSVRGCWWHLGPSFLVDGHQSRSRAPFHGRALLWWDWGWMECTGWLWDGFGMDGWTDGGAAHPPWSTAAGPGCSCRAFLVSPSSAPISSLTFAVPRPFPHVLPVGALFQVSWWPGLAQLQPWQLCLSLQVPTVVLGLERTPKANLLPYPSWKSRTCVLLA